MNRWQKLGTAAAALAAVIGLIVALTQLETTTQTARAAKTPQQLNGSQSPQQAQGKINVTVTILNQIASTQNKQRRAKLCDQLPTGQGHLGVCAKAPVYGAHGIAPPTTGATVLSGAFGIDTSHWDYCGGRALAGPRFWIVAVGDGTYIDPCAGPIYHSLRAAGLPRSTYYFVRQYLSPIWSADHYAALIRQMGATDSLVPVDDAEAITSCSWIHTFDNRLKSDLHLSRVMDYSSPGLWPGCNGQGNAAYTAAYGPLGQRLAGGGFVSYVIQQTSDGTVGPFPHCVAVCGDIDLATSSFAPIAVKPPPPPSPPIAYTYWKACYALGGIVYYKQHDGHGHVSSTQHRHAVAIKMRLGRAGLGCAKPGWQYRPPKAFRTFPVHGHGQKGNLA